MCGRSRFGRAVVEQATNRYDLCLRSRIAGENRQQPTDGFEREFVESGFGNQPACFRGVTVSHPVANVERVGDERAASINAVV